MAGTRLGYRCPGVRIQLRSTVSQARSKVFRPVYRRNGVTGDEKLVRDCVVQAVDEFETNLMGARTLRRFAAETPGLFASVAISLLLSGEDSAGHRYLAMLLLKNPVLFTQLSNPWQYTRAQAVTLAKQLMHADPSLDLRLARQLPGREGVIYWDTLQGAAAERALDILDEISTGRRVIPILSHLTRYPDRVISSKATLFIGRRLQNLAWAKRMMGESPDPRVRANAIESVWGVDSADIIDLFWQCTQDRHNRVVGNAIVGLHLAGVETVEDVVKRFAHDYQPEFRVTSAWAMGKIGDPKFIPDLAPLVKDENATVRSAALRALQTIRRNEKRHEPPLEPVLATAPPLPEPAPEPQPEPEIEESVVPWIDVRLDGRRFASRK